MYDNSIATDERQDGAKTAAAAAARRTDTESQAIQFTLETASDSLTDLALFVFPAHPPSSNDARRLRGPRWIRERRLTETNEIQDLLLDARTRRTCWSVCRSVDGRWMRAASPHLPPGISLALNPAPSNVPSAMGSTPYVLALTTKLHLPSLHRVEAEIDAEAAQGHRSLSKGIQTHRHSRTLSNPFTAIDLDGERRQEHRFAYPPAPETRREHTDVQTTENTERAIRNTGVESGKKGHIRRRSAGNSTSQPNPRNVSNTPTTPRVPEEDEAQFATVTEAEGTREESESNGSTMVEECVEQSNIAPRSSPTHAGASNNSWSAPRSCSIVLSDGAYGQSSRDSHRQSGGIARLAWDLIPHLVRPALSLGGSKTFSITWIDAPSNNASTSQREVEILRFVDESGWRWKEKKVGRLWIQRSAVQALNLDLSLWISLALSYLNVLEERDGYNASFGG